VNSRRTAVCRSALGSEARSRLQHQEGAPSTYEVEGAPQLHIPCVLRSLGRAVLWSWPLVQWTFPNSGCPVPVCSRSFLLSAVPDTGDVGDF
jgi:hypothetical protein